MCNYSVKFLFSLWYLCSEVYIKLIRDFIVSLIMAETRAEDMSGSDIHPRKEEFSHACFEKQQKRLPFCLKLNARAQYPCIFIRYSSVGFDHRLSLGFRLSFRPWSALRNIKNYSNWRHQYLILNFFSNA